LSLDDAAELVTVPVYTMDKEKRAERKTETVQWWAMQLLRNSGADGPSDAIHAWAQNAAPDKIACQNALARRVIATYASFIHVSTQTELAELCGRHDGDSAAFRQEVQEKPALREAVLRGIALSMVATTDYFGITDFGASSRPSKAVIKSASLG